MPFGPVRPSYGHVCQRPNCVLVNSSPSGIGDYLPIGQFWRRNWARITPFFGFQPETLKVIYTTNAIELVNMSLRNISKKWTDTDP